MSSSNVTFGTYCRQRINKDSPIVLADKLNGCEPTRRGRKLQCDNKAPKCDLILQGNKSGILFLAYIFKHVKFRFFFFSCLTCTQIYKEISNMPVKCHKKKKDVQYYK